MVEANIKKRCQIDLIDVQRKFIQIKPNMDFKVWVKSVLHEKLADMKNR